MKKPLRIHAKSLSDALAPSKKKIACSAGLRRLCEASAFITGVTIVCKIFARKPATDGQQNQTSHEEGTGAAY